MPTNASHQDRFWVTPVELFNKLPLLMRNSTNSHFGGYLRYFHDVLGIKEFILPSRLPAPVEGEAVWQSWGDSVAPLVVLSLISCEEESLLHEPQRELFHKMWAAMKLGEAEPMVIEGNVQNDLRTLSLSLPETAPVGLAFCSDPVVLPEVFGSFGIWERFAGVRWMATYHPCTLVQQPQLKKPTWAHLQSVMQEVTQVAR